jgi:hypothetical protein
VSPVAVVVLPDRSSKPITYTRSVNVPPASSSSILAPKSDPVVVMRMGRMFSPNELSMPPMPSVCVALLAPGARVHTSDASLVVTRLSRL